MELINDLLTLAFTELVHRCQEETSRYLKTKLSDNRYCYEIFRLALVEKQQLAWDALYQQYSPLVSSWIQRGNQLAQISEDVNVLINETFARFWGAMSAEKFAASTDVNSLLDYLKTCAGSAVADQNRRAQRVKNTGGLPDYLPDEDSKNAHAMIDEQELFDQINQRLKDEDEKLVFKALFSLGMKPNEICAEWSQRFPTVRRVNQIRQNMVDRLGRDEALRRYYKLWIENRGLG